MKITFIQPAMGHGERPYVRSWQMEPLTIATLVGLTPACHECVLYDDRLEPIAYDQQTDLVVLTVETYTALRAYQIGVAYRQRGVPVVMGGYHPTLVTDEVLGFADAVVKGDAEGVWAQLLADAEQGQLQRLYHDPSPACLQRVQPDRSIFADKRYLPIGLVESGRGCTFGCDFCAVAAFARGRYRARPPRELVQEIEASGRDKVFLVDDNFTAHPGRTKTLLRELAPLGVKWMSQASLQTADDPELLDLLRRSGCVALLIGFESLDPITLRAMNKRFNRGGRDAYAERIQRLRDHGIMLYATFVFGYDSDTPDVFERTLEFAMQQKFMVAAFNHLQPFPGTPLYRALQAQGRLLHPRWWLQPEVRFGDIVFEPRSMAPDELRARLMQMRRRFFGLSSTLRRATDLKANCNDLLSLQLYLAANLTLRREIQQKWSTPLGDTAQPLPHLAEVLSKGGDLTLPPAEPRARAA